MTVPGAFSGFDPKLISQRLVDWIHNYTGLELKWDCRLVLKRDEVPPLLLGYTGRLGWTTWLGTRLADSDADDLVLEGR